MKKIKVLHFSTHNENCGIGKYNEMFLDAMAPSELVKNSFFETSPNILRIMNEDQKNVMYDTLRSELEGYDILHIQHEFSFLHSVDFPRLARLAKDLNKKLIITVHTSPTLAYEKPHLSGYGPRNIVRFARQYKRKIAFDKLFTAAVVLADKVLVHNTVTQNALIDLGVEREKTAIIMLPVPAVDRSLKTTLIAKKLHKKEGDIIIAITGFLHKYKGIDHAVKALTYLPQNYKLAIIGGMHIDHDAALYDSIADLIRDLGLQERVYITGFVEDDAQLNALIRECDISVYPYDRHYYSNISSASLNNGFANYKPVVAYPTDSFVELNNKTDSMVLPKAFAYYELAREIESLDIDASTEKSKHFAEIYSYKIVSDELVGIYSKI